MFIIKYKKAFLAISALMMLVSIGAAIAFGLKFGIEFTGGSVIEFTTKQEMKEGDVRARLDKAYPQNFTLDEADGHYSLHISGIGGEATHNFHVLNVISGDNPDNLVIEKYDTVGPTLGSELKNKALVALGLAILAIALFIAYAFRHVSQPVSSWKYGLVTMIALVHDVVITIGVFAFLGHYAGIEMDSLFLTALLVILGYSINDTVVVFDRIRENLANTPDERRDAEFENVIGSSLSQTFVRSLNTSVTTLFASAVIFALSLGSVKNFALALLVGMASGTYSSIFVAAPLLTYFKKREEKA